MLTSSSISAKSNIKLKINIAFYKKYFDVYFKDNKIICNNKMFNYIKNSHHYKLLTFFIKSYKVTS